MWFVGTYKFLLIEDLRSIVYIKITKNEFQETLNKQYAGLILSGTIKENDNSALNQQYQIPSGRTSFTIDILNTPASSTKGELPDLTNQTICLEGAVS